MKIPNQFGEFEKNNIVCIKDINGNVIWEYIISAFSKLSHDIDHYEEFFEGQAYLNMLKSMVVLEESYKSLNETI